MLWTCFDIVGGLAVFLKAQETLSWRIQFFNNPEDTPLNKKKIMTQYPWLV